MKRISTLILAVFMVCGLFCVSSAAADTEQWWEQDVWSTDVLVSLGAVLPDYDPASDTYRISAPEQLLYLSGLWKPEDTNGDHAPDAPCGGTYVLTQDLDMSPLLERIGAVIADKTGNDTKGFMPPIGALADNGKEEGVHCAFFGTFDGQGHAIRNLRVVRMGNKYCGLFGNVGHDFGEGYVKNLAILDAEIKGLSSCGILAGSLYGDADNVVCTGKIDCREKNAGGLAGKIKRNENGYCGIARNCFVDCEIIVRGKGNENGAAGGITASCSGGGQVVNCYAAGSIEIGGEEADSVGGLIGNLKGGTAVDNNVMLLSEIDGGDDSQNIGYLCGNYAGDSGSHIHGNVVWNGTRLMGGVSSTHPEEAAYALVGSEQIRSKELYESLGWDLDDVWTWVGDESDGYPMIRAFADAVDLKDRIDGRLIVSAPVLRLSEPMKNSAYSGETVRIDALLAPEGVTAGEALVHLGTGKKRSACTETVPMQRTEAGFTADLSLDIGTYYYYCTVEADGRKLSFPTEGTVRLDVVSETVRYVPEQLTLTPGATAAEMCFNWITAADGLSAELRWRERDESSWTVVPVTEIERVNVRGDHGTFTSYSVDLTGLKPGTDYKYMAVTKDGTNDYQSSVYEFRTLPAQKAFSFVLVSDLQSTNEEGYLPFLYTDQTFLTDTLHPDFIVNLGDLTEDDTMAEWTYLFDQLQGVLATTPTAYVPGNHESKGDVVYSHFKGRTNLPRGIDDEMLAETTASFVVGDVCFVILNTEPYTGIDGADASQDKLRFYEQQKAWAKDVLEASGCAYRIVLAHAGLVQKDDAATAFLEQMCEELQVDLFFNGHIHNYFRATVNGSGEKAEPGEATTFVTISPMGMKFDEYGGELDGLLGFQTGGQSDERQYLAYVEVTEEGIVVTAYQRTEAGDASPKKCADYTAIDSFAIRHEQSQPAEPEAAAKTEEKPAAETKPAAEVKPAAETKPEAAATAAAAERTVPWAAIGCGAAAIAVILLVVIFKKRKTVK